MADVLVNSSSMFVTIAWILLAVIGAAALLEGLFQLVGRVRSWRAGIVSKIRWAVAVVLLLVALGVIASLEYNVRPPAGPHADANTNTVSSTSTHAENRANAEDAKPVSVTKAAVVSDKAGILGPTASETTATETSGVTSDAEEYLRATTGFEKQRAPEIDETLPPSEVSNLIKQTGRGATNWFLLTDGPVKVFCISGGDNRVTSLLCPKTPCDLNTLPLCHHIRVKNEDTSNPVRVRIWYYNPFGPRDNRAFPGLPGLQ